jgi:hypothetical protein
LKFDVKFIFCKNSNKSLNKLLGFNCAFWVLSTKMSFKAQNNFWYENSKAFFNFLKA